MITMDNFYKDLTPEQMEDIANYNFDSPDSLDFDEMHEAVLKLLDYEDVEIPDYDFSINARVKPGVILKASHFILFEGILALHDERLRELMDLKIYVTESSDTRLARRIRRDTTERGRTLENVLFQWHKTVKPSYDEYVHKTMKTADIIVNGNDSNHKAISFIVNNLKMILRQYLESPNHEILKAKADSQKEIKSEKESPEETK
mmetsp:Transcript_3803/g.3549  ORF Transcript_3803/g.3549 Transcript_3803/m.3549 type:complete len:204 (+) Transcript_3803:117-728(+)|eukprot:CAMPEP_0197006866 /NCGR_PEP_ID=MMETSP1380-20130617/37603_1 /TAXON_ID=5936 /ORGANISM="Euplotes crassus, Strain CT5" /LENGTH=203 /DNA_ID=CAMNT_0042426695 /DNA_START=117 /DNA_END=728 /DNA_ORIENTATION=+